MSGQGTSYACANLTYVHDPYFGGNLVLYASSLPSSYRALSSNNGFDALGLAKGFIVHILGDLVGFRYV